MQIKVIVTNKGVTKKAVLSLKAAEKMMVDTMTRLNYPDVAKNAMANMASIKAGNIIGFSRGNNVTMQFMVNETKEDRELKALFGLGG